MKIEALGLGTHSYSDGQREYSVSIYYLEKTKRHKVYRWKYHTTLREFIDLPLAHRYIREYSIDKGVIYLGEISVYATIVDFDEALYKKAVRELQSRMQMIR